jgi:hypothetical protein
MLSVGEGLAQSHCRYHVQFRARHGSHWCPTYKAADLRPYLQSAAQWIKQRRTEPFIARSLIALRALLDGAGPVHPAQDIKWRTAPSRGRIAFARLREANVKPERLLAIHMAVSALIEDDAGSHRVTEYRIVQVAKCAHRLASGTHRHWEIPLDDGRLAPIEFHAYPKSSGRVLRVIGKEIEEICSGVTERDLQALRDLKLARFGPHHRSCRDGSLCGSVSLRLRRASRSYAFEWLIQCELCGKRMLDILWDLTSGEVS